MVKPKSDFKKYLRRKLQKRNQLLIMEQAHVYDRVERTVAKSWRLRKTKSSTLKHLVIAASTSGLDVVLFIVSEPRISFLLGEFVRRCSTHTKCVCYAYISSYQ